MPVNIIDKSSPNKRRQYRPSPNATGHVRRYRGRELCQTFLETFEATCPQRHRRGSKTHVCFRATPRLLHTSIPLSIPFPQTPPRRRRRRHSCPLLHLLHLPPYPPPSSSLPNRTPHPRRDLPRAPHRAHGRSSGTHLPHNRSRARAATRATRVCPLRCDGCAGCTARRAWRGKDRGCCGGGGGLGGWCGLGGCFAACARCGGGRFDRRRRSRNGS
jgi:hypothetical protein